MYLNFNQKGQSLLIVVLVIVVALTVTLSVVSRSIVNLKTSIQQNDSQKALAAAEAGIEQAIKTKPESGISVPITVGNGTVTSNEVKLNSATSDSAFLAYGGNVITKDDGASIWLSPYPINTAIAWSGTLTVYWGDSSGADNNAALEIVILSKDAGGRIIISKEAYDPSGSRRGPGGNNNGNNFSSPDNLKPAGCSASGVNMNTKFTYSQNLTIINGYLLKIIPIYKPTTLAICDKTYGLPTQGQTIESSATSGDVQRKVTVFQGFPELPAELFPYNLMSF